MDEQTNQTEQAMAELDAAEAAEGEATVEATEAVEATTATATDEAKAERQTASVMLHLPIAFKEMLENKAKENNESLAAYLRQTIATSHNYTLPAMTTRAPRGEFAGLSPEEKKKAISAKQKDQRDTLKAVLAAAKAGKVDLKSLLAQFGPTGTGAAANTAQVNA